MKKTVFLKCIAIFRDCYLFVCYGVTIIRIKYLFKVSLTDRTLYVIVKRNVTHIRWK